MQHGIKHRLYISTLAKPWDLIFNTRPSQSHLRDSSLNLKKLKYSECLSSSSLKSSGILESCSKLGGLVTDLRMESALNDEKDLNLVTRIFSHLSGNLRKMTLDISQWKSETLLALPCNLIPPTTKTVTFRIYNEVSG